VRYAIIGCGLIGTKRAEAVTRIGGSVTAAADLDFERARRLCGRFGGTPARKAEDAIAGADAAIVAVTHDRLAELGLMAVSSGKHVLIEKPGARNAKELAPLKEAAEKRGVRVKVGYNHRFHPAPRKARALVDEGELGELMFIRGRYGHGGRPGYSNEWRFDPTISGGGELLDQGSHLIDLAGWFLGEFTGVYGLLPRFFWEGTVEDNCFLTLQAKSGAVAHLHASWTEWKNMFSLEIYGRAGKVAIDGLGGSYGTERIAFYKMLPEMGPPETTIFEYPFPDNSWELELREFEDAVREGRPPIVDIRDALRNLSVTDALYERRREK
jgi:predicted dehydrogenase